MILLKHLGWRVALALSVLSLALYSCSPDISLIRVAPPKQRAVLSVWLWPGSGLETMIKQYAEEQSGVDVDIVISQYDDVLPGLMSSLATRSKAPDLVLLDASQLGEMKRYREQFYNLYDFGDERTRFLEWKWRLAENRDGAFLFAMPADIGPVALAYRRDLFEAAGLPAERDAVSEAFTDWDALESAGLQLKEKTGAALFDNMNNVFQSYFNQFDGQYLGSRTGRLSPRVKEAWDRAVRFQQLGLIAGLPSQTTEWADGAVNGRFAAVLAPSWLHGMLKKNAPATRGLWDLAKAPGLPSGWKGSFLAIPKTSGQPREAYALASWLTTPQRQLATFRSNGNFPSTPTLYSTRDFLDVRDPFFNDAPTGQIYAYAALRLNYAYGHSADSSVESLLREGLRRVEKGEARPEQAWRDVEKRIQQIDKGE